MINRSFLTGALAVAAFMIMAVPSHATLVTGTLFIAGQANVAISAPGGVGNIHFNTDSGGDMFQANLTSSGTFAGVAGTLGKTTTDINQASVPAGVVLATPLLFLTFDAMPGLSYFITEMDLGTYGSGSCGAPASVPQACSPSSTPYNLTNNTAGGATGVSAGQAGFTTEGFFRLGGMDTPYTGSWTAATTQSYQSILALIAGGGTYTTAWAARFDQTPTAVPEPGTYALLLSGAVMLALGVFRRRKA